MLHFNVRKIVNVFGHKANISNYVSTDKSSNPKVLNPVKVSLIRTGVFLAVILLVSIVFKPHVPQKQAHVKYLQDMERFKEDIGIIADLDGDDTMASYYNNHDFETVLLLAERNLTQLSYRDRAMMAFAYVKTEQVSDAVTWLSIISEDVADPYKEQAEYNMAYLYFKYGNAKSLEVLDNIIRQKKHAYRGLAIELIQHPTMDKLMMKLGEEKLARPSSSN